LEAMGAPTGGLQVVQGARNWWHPGRSGSLKMGPKTVVAEFGEVHPRVLKALGVDGPVLAFELFMNALPHQKAKVGKAKGKLDLSPLMPLTRDFAFLMSADKPAGEIVRAVAGADKALITDLSVFDRYQGQGVAEGEVSVALQVTISPRDKTLTDGEIEALSGKIISAVSKQGGRLR
jgi:phenylalanyl-tRNA synthetase beta chain